MSEVRGREAIFLCFQKCPYLPSRFHILISYCLKHVTFITVYCSCQLATTYVLQDKRLPHLCCVKWSRMQSQNELLNFKNFLGYQVSSLPAFGNYWIVELCDFMQDPFYLRPLYQGRIEGGFWKPLLKAEHIL